MKLHLRGVALLVVLTAVVLAAPAPAYAHVSLESSTPADGATLATAPDAVTLTFSGAVLPDSTVVVTGPQGAVQLGPATAAGTAVTQPLQSGLPAGRYTVSYEVVADDGAPIAGSVSFAVQGGSSTAASPPTTADASSAATSTPPAQAASPSDPGGSRWLWTAVAIAVIVAAIVASVALRRRPPRTAK